MQSDFTNKQDFIFIRDLIYLDTGGNLIDHSIEDTVSLQTNSVFSSVWVFLWSATYYLQDN